jgi:hypothetical protein
MISRNPLVVSQRAFLVGVSLIFAAPFAVAEIVWDGSFESGDYNSYPWAVPGKIEFWGMNRNLRPKRYSAEQNDSAQIGNGTQSGIVHRTGTTVTKSFGSVAYPAGPVRAGNYAARITVRNSTNGSEPQDCGESDNGRCEYRRTEIWTWGGRDSNFMAHYLNALPQFQERWISYSVFLPSNFAMASASGFWPIVLQIKPRWGGRSMSPTFAIALHPTQGWSLTHRTHPEITNNLIQHGLAPGPGEFNYNNAHDTEYRKTTGQGFKDYLAVDFPEANASRTALGELGVGQWTDWVIHLKADPRGPSDGGTGFMRVWKRTGAGKWTQVLDIVPREFDVGGYRLNRGVFLNDPGGATGNRNPIPANWANTLANASGEKYSEQNGGFSVMTGFYGARDYFWNAPRDVTIYIDNVKVGSAAAKFEMMSPDGSTPDGATPAAPVLQVN